jgi:hypothetical protein
MDCVVCSQTGGTYRLVGGDVRLTVCEQCVAEYLLDDLAADTCKYCEAPGDLALVEYTGPMAATDRNEGGDGDLSGRDDHVADAVLCLDHVEKLGAEGL